MARYRKINGEWFDTSSGLPQVESGWIKFGEGSASNNEINIPIPKNASELLFVGNNFAPADNDGMSILIPVQKLRDVIDAYKIGYDPDGSNRHNMLVYLDNSKIIKIRVRNSTTDVGDAKYTMYYKPATIIGKTTENYSTEEQVIGTWIDGKPLYRKVVNVNNITIRDYDYTHNIANIFEIVQCRGSVIKDSGVTLPLPYYHNQNIYAIGIFASTSIIGFRAGDSAELPYNATIILEYTKVGD